MVVLLFTIILNLTLFKYVRGKYLVYLQKNYNLASKYKESYIGKCFIMYIIESASLLRYNI